MPVSPRLLRGSKKPHPTNTVEDPSDIDGLFGWYEDDQEAYQTEGGVVAGIGDPVGYWGDLSGAGNHLTEITDRPTRTGDGISFDGVSNILTSPIITGITRPFTIFLIARTTESGGGFENSKLAVAETNAAWGISCHALVSLYIMSPQPLNVPAFGPDVGVDYIYTGVYNGATSLIRVNDGTYTIGDTGVGNTFDGFVMGYGIGLAGVRKQVVIKAFVGYGRLLDSDERDSIIAYLNEKYAIY